MISYRSLDIISYIKNKISKGMGIIIKARKYLNRKSLLDLYHAFVFWGNMSNIHLDALVKIIKKNCLYNNLLSISCKHR